MKKFRALIATFTMMYIVMAGGLFLAVQRYESNVNNEYRVEINRIKSDFIEEYIKSQDSQNVPSAINLSANEYGVYLIDAQKYSYAVHVHNIMYMSGGELGQQMSQIEKFYEPGNKYQIEIVPVAADDEVKGYLRFDYAKNVRFLGVLVTAELFMLCIFLVAVGALVYTNQRIIRPFNQMSSMPYELSKGNLGQELEESKNKYFGRFLWGLGMLKDTLDLHRQKELKLAKDKKMLVLSVSHDIKTPLNAINLYAKALENGLYDTEKETQEAAVKIQEKAAEINDFVSELIKSSTEEVVTIDVADSEYYLKDLMTKVDNGFTAKCDLRNIQFTIAEYENLLMKGDLDRMYEAIGNLIENAVKYGDGKRIGITFSMEEGYQLIHVRNSGQPIAENEASHLFESFYRGSNAEGKKGNGLGLYICREIMRKMNGDIYAVSLEDGMEIVLVCRMC